MNADILEPFARAEATGYMPALRRVVQSCCVPFWWHGIKPDGRYGILRNGTFCLVDTGTKILGITANHVYQQYLQDKSTNASVVGQLGSSTANPEEYLVAYDESLDLATFELPTVLITAAGASAHRPLFWPPDGIREGEIALFGGHPGRLREEMPATAELPFQWFTQRLTSVSTSNLALQLDLKNIRWLTNSEPFNPALGGMSGGPVFRFIPAPPIERLELAGFIYEYQESLGLMFARPASCVAVDGSFARP